MATISGYDSSSIGVLFSSLNSGSTKTSAMFGTSDLLGISYSDYALSLIHIQMCIRDRVCVVAMFAMALTSDSPTIVDYQSKLLNRYASWEQELTEREKAVSEKEQELGIQVDTEQTDFTDSP